MKAIIFEQFGEPADILQLREAADPQPQKGQVRVRMLVSPINPSDLMTVRGIYGKLPSLPATPGFEGVGIVEASGGGLLGRMLVGKRVAVLNGDTGNWCEQTVVPAKQAIPLSREIPIEQAAMFFVNPATAYIMTQKVLKLRAGDWLLQTAAGSALGQMVIRLGKEFGFRTLNVVRREAQVEELKKLGGDAVVAFDPARQESADLRAAVQEKTGGTGVSAVIDPVGGATGSAALNCLADGGRMIVYGTLSAEPLSFSPRELMTPGTSIEGFWLARWMMRQKLVGKLRLVRDITRLMQAGVLVSEVGETFPLEEIRSAVTKAEEVGRGGKVLLRIADE